MIERQLRPAIEALLGSGKAIIIMGARQVGKSTLLREMFGVRNDVLWLNGDDMDVRELFKNMTSDRLRLFLSGKSMLIVDEAQRIEDIGLKLKVITDQIEGVQVIATGSSSFQLASKVNESLTGRKREFQMFPLSFKEMVSDTDLLKETRLIPHQIGRAHV